MESRSLTTHARFLSRARLEGFWSGTMRSTRPLRTISTGTPVSWFRRDRVHILAKLGGGFGRGPNAGEGARPTNAFGRAVP